MEVFWSHFSVCKTLLESLNADSWAWPAGIRFRSKMMTRSLPIQQLLLSQVTFFGTGGQMLIPAEGTNGLSRISPNLHQLSYYPFPWLLALCPLHSSSHGHIPWPVTWILISLDFPSSIVLFHWVPCWKAFSLIPEYQSPGPCSRTCSGLFISLPKSSN